MFSQIFFHDIREMGQQKMNEQDEKRRTSLIQLMEETLSTKMPKVIINFEKKNIYVGCFEQLCLNNT